MSEPRGGGFRGRWAGGMALKIALLVALQAGMFVANVRAQLLDQNAASICEFTSCLNWCECSAQSEQVNIAGFGGDLIFAICPFIPGFNVYENCDNDPRTAFIAQTYGANVKECRWTRDNPLIFFQNVTQGNGSYALRIWEGVNPADYQLIEVLCSTQCNAACGIFPPTEPAPTTEAVLTRKIDDMIPKFNTTLASTTSLAAPGGLSLQEVIGIAVGVFVAVLLLCLIIVFLCCRKRRRKGPKLPPRRYANQNGNAENRDYATIEELNLTPVTTPKATGHAFPNLLYRSESLAALNSQQPGPTMSRSMSDLALLGDPPHPPLQRNTSLLPGINPAMADGTDGRTAPIDEYGYTKYLPEEETPPLPYMHLKVTPTLSDPSGSGRPRKPHRYRSNTGDNTHASATDVDRMLSRMRSKEALRDSSNRRFVPNQAGRTRSSTFGEDYNRLVRRGQRPVPRSRKAAESAGAFTAVPVHGQYHSRPRRSPQSIRKWRSLPDMTDGGSPSPSGSERRPEGYQPPPVYHLLESSQASSIEDYSNRRTRLLTDVENGYIQPLPDRKEDPRKDGSGGRGHYDPSHRAPGWSDTLGDRYDPVYEPGRVCNGHSGSQGDYQPLAVADRGQDAVDSDDEAYQGPVEMLDKDAYLKPKRTTKSAPRSNGRLNSDGHEPVSPTSSHSSGNLSSRSNSRNKPYIYEKDNNNLSPVKSSPGRKVGSGGLYSPLKSSDHKFDFDDDMENGEYMYHPAGPSMDTMV